MNSKLSVVVLAVAMVLTTCVSVKAGQIGFNIETGLLSSGYNIFRIPGDGGTQVSVSDAFGIEPTSFLRGRVNFKINARHEISFLLAPLTLTTEGTAPFPIIFEDQTFAANTKLKALYQFNSYRLTYHYQLMKTENIEWRIGFTGKVREAEISLESDDVKAAKKNTGFVPLLYMKLDWTINGPWHLMLDADALAAPQGRAEDVLIAFKYQYKKNASIRLGYRFVEGGADNDEVYNFAAIHYVVIGTQHYF